MKKVAMGLWVVLMLIGCATIERSNTLDQERVLAAAGFRMKPADTPEKLHNLSLLPQQQLVSHERDGKVVYLFADTTTCLCLYVGSQKAYYRYQRMAMEKQIADERSIAGTMNPGMGLDWGMWDPWDVDGPMDYYYGW
jgi:hypothetical protein